MADTYLNIKGKLIKLYDQGDGTFSLTPAVTTNSTGGTFHSAAPTKGEAIGGVYSTADPAYHDGDLTKVRTNAKGEIIVEIPEAEADSFEQITIADTATGLTTIPTGAVKAVIYIETAPIRFRIDGTDPTATVGQPALADDIITLNCASDIAHFKAIRTGTTSALLSVTYFV